MAKDNTSEIIKILSQAFGKAIEKAWKGDVLDTIIDPNSKHEANHVARFVYGMPEPMVAAIKRVNGVQSVSVEGMFCHKSPFAFWDRQGAAEGVERRELADLMVEVEIASNQGCASRAVLVQTKMKVAQDWKAPLKIGKLALAKEQRELYTYLPPFCLELFNRPTAQTVRDQKLTVSQSQNLIVYNLGGNASLPSKNPGGLVYAVIKNCANRTAQNSPWLVENGRPPMPANQSALDTLDGDFSLDFAEALANMVVENRIGKMPPIGIRSDGSSGMPVGWNRLIKDLKLFARQRLQELDWDQTSNPPKKKLLDVVVLPVAGKSESKALLNRATFAMANGQVQWLAKCVRTPRWLMKPDWFDSFDTMAGAELLVREGRGRTPEDLRKLELRVPEGGFGYLKIRIATSEMRN